MANQQPTEPNQESNPQQQPNDKNDSKNQQHKVYPRK